MRNQEIENHLRGVQYLYWFTLFVMALSGFGQMPIYKRYYMADIPGMAWVAHFYTTHYLHYLASVVLIALVFYFASGYLADIRKRVRLTASGRLRVAAVAAVIGSGGLLVYRNFPGYHFSQGTIIFLDIFHLLAAMTLLFSGFYCVVKKKKWTVTIS